MKKKNSNRKPSRNVNKTRNVSQLKQMSVDLTLDLLKRYMRGGIRSSPSRDFLSSRKIINPIDNCFKQQLIGITLSS